MSWLRGKPQDKPRHYRNGRKTKPSAEAIADLRYECFLRDNWKCVACGVEILVGDEINDCNPRKAHMSHKRHGIHRGWTLDDVETRCNQCHSVGIHNPKPCPSKPKMESQW